ncbi:unnamed protein product [Spirodela intermedia]|uniref:CCHC-type domain-containing protein n=1 Tax=Spirodela intermedia TaxID=51605 RepID=A0A7I8LD35_SPIIN|nr:unnamed protein product [Spirodela intermedia]
MEQYVDLDKISLNEVIGSLSVHELRLKERESQEEEYALLARALSKGTITSEESSSHGRDQHHSCGRGRGRGSGRGQHPPLDEGKKYFDKSQIQCYNCEKYDHFAYECRSAKKTIPEQAYVAKSLEKPEVSSLLMMIVEEQSDLLL